MNDWRVIFGALLLLALATSSSHSQVPAPTKYERGVLIRFEREIDRWRAQWLYRKLEDARRQNADLIVLEIDSPGGMLEESLNIADRLRDLDWAHVVAYIPKQALSGAAIVALGCDQIMIDPQASFGNAGVIFQDKDFLFKYAPEKIRSAVVQRVRDLAEGNGRPPALAEAMIDMDVVVFHVKHETTGQETYMSDAEIEAHEQSEQWTRLKPVLESRDDNFLIVNGSRATQLGLAEKTVEDRNQLRQELHVERALTVLRHTWVDTTIQLLNSPLLTGFLLVVGLVALYVELSAPGISVGGLLAGLCFALFFWSRFMGGTAAWLEVVLFVAGLVFIATELFVIPGFGLPGLTGIVLVLVSLVMASQDFVIPETSRELSTVATSLTVILVSGAAFVVTAVLLSRYMGELPVLNRLILRPPRADADLKLPGHAKSVPTSKLEGAPPHSFPVEIGDTGTADSALRPAGKARFGNDYVDVVTDGLFVDQGDRIRVIDISGNRVMVRRIGRDGNQT